QRPVHRAHGAPAQQCERAVDRCPGRRGTARRGDRAAVPLHAVRGRPSPGTPRPDRGDRTRAAGARVVGGYAIVLAIAVGITLVMTPIVRVLVIRMGAVKVPRDLRDVHTKPMPTLGGAS